MFNTIEVKITNNYGNKLVYPMNKEGEIFCQIAGTKTLTEGTINNARKLGYKFVVISEKL
tara:strand:- start:174 stop:353 length:180 start_codon:yes stop_codon:yes gene_type:complete